MTFSTEFLSTDDKQYSDQWPWACHAPINSDELTEGYLNHKSTD